MCITERLTKKYHFYAQYHRNFCNKLIHFICIPNICFSLFVLLNYIPFEFDFTKYIPNDTSHYLEKITIPECTFILRPSFILYLLYFIYYIYFSPCIGFISNVFYFGILLVANFFYCEVPNAFIYALGIRYVGEATSILLAGEFLKIDNLIPQDLVHFTVFFQKCSQLIQFPFPGLVKGFRNFKVFSRNPI